MIANKKLKSALSQQIQHHKSQKCELNVIWLPQTCTKTKKSSTGQWYLRSAITIAAMNEKIRMENNNLHFLKNCSTSKPSSHTTIYLHPFLILTCFSLTDFSFTLVIFGACPFCHLSFIDSFCNSVKGSLSICVCSDIDL